MYALLAFAIFLFFGHILKLSCGWVRRWLILLYDHFEIILPLNINMVQKKEFQQILFIN